ncbi:MFS general substrate transporter [Aspergillus sclerotioniger CBS 115572]|uniref:MFS general substrate transporter n=1 Tax=Aspergillus sclerotioniger CBS 115572 TaxID=1450535 RepID=A0A317W7B7_9EURO|nr:MFS general substrate transporter [Aspergillus sclerotioniger CBS 115572]PWY81571.1 MFS general substrate transporter [Aspergillus sclerotioniger CBS 115572]
MDSTGHSNGLKRVPEWEDDPANAQNWSVRKKIYNTAVPSILCLLISFALAIYSPSHSHVQTAFHTSTTKSLLPFTMYVYGLAFGPMIAAPISETYGRRLIYLVMTPLAMLFILGAGFSQNLASLAVCRLLAGMFISAPLAVGAGTIMDMWSGPATGGGVTILMTIAFMGPAFGSLVGGWVAEYKGWRWSQWTTLFLGAACWVFSLGAQETYSRPILRRRAAKLGLPVPPSPIPRGLAGIRMMLTVTLARPVYMLLTEPIVALCSLYSSLNFSVLFCFLACVPLVYTDIYDFTPGQCGLVFISLALGCVLGCLGLLMTDQYTMSLHRRRHPEGNTPPPPEQVLWAAMLASPVMPAALFWFAWTSTCHVHWMSSIVAIGFFGCSNIMIFVSTVLYLTRVYGATSGASALAANGLLRYSIGGSFPLFTLAMYHNLGYSWASSLLGFLAVAFAPLPWLFFRWGSRVRENSAYTS